MKEKLKKKKKKEKKRRKEIEQQHLIKMWQHDIVTRCLTTGAWNRVSQREDEIIKDHDCRPFEKNSRERVSLPFEYQYYLMTAYHIATSDFFHIN